MDFGGGISGGGSRYCRPCNTHMPLVLPGGGTPFKCPGCGASTIFSGKAWDADWAKRLRGCEELPTGAVDGPAYDAESWDIPILGVEIRDDRGLLWIDSRDVIRANGGRSWEFKPGQMLFIGGKFYEVESYSYPQRRYWLTVLRTELTDDDLRKLRGE